MAQKPHNTQRCPVIHVIRRVGRIRAHGGQSSRSQNFEIREQKESLGEAQGEGVRLKGEERSHRLGDGASGELANPSSGRPGYLVKGTLPMHPFMLMAMLI